MSGRKGMDQEEREAPLEKTMEIRVDEGFVDGDSKANAAENLIQIAEEGAMIALPEIGERSPKELFSAHLKMGDDFVKMTLRPRMAFFEKSAQEIMSRDGGAAASVFRRFRGGAMSALVMKASAWMMGAEWEKEAGKAVEQALAAELAKRALDVWEERTAGELRAQALAQGAMEVMELASNGKPKERPVKDLKKQARRV